MAIAISPVGTSYLRPCYGHAADPDGALPLILSKPSAAETKTTTDNPSWRLVATVLLPFAAGYYLSYVFRTINALISGPLATEFGLAAADLGLLTAVLFLTFGAVQLPLGSWLDRFGPRRVQAALLSIAAIGATIFAWAPNLLWLILGRALIGLGVAGALMGGLKAIVLWWPAERIALANGWLITLGALGAVTATAPSELLIASIGWRGLFLLLAVLAVTAALLILRFVPGRPARGPDEAINSGMTIRTIYRDARFWRLAPLSATTIASAWAFQGLWAGPWLADVEGLPRHDVVMHLMWMAIALSASALILGSASDRLRRRGVSLSAIFAFASGLAVLAQLALILRWPVPTWLPWIAIAGIGAGTVLSYAIVAELFPKSASGRASGALNLLHIGAAFVVQLGTGFVLDLWPVEAGRHPAVAYQNALGINLTLQAAAFLWFLRPERHAVVVRLRAHPIHGIATALGITPATAVPYLLARQIWSAHQNHALLQTSAWRLAALSAVAGALSIATSLAVVIHERPPRALLQEHFDLDGRRQIWRLLSTDSARNIPISARDRPTEDHFPFVCNPARWSEKLDKSIMMREEIEPKDRWPRLMTASTAAAYCGERSPYSFRRAVGRLWPRPVRLPGKGERWLKDDLDLVIDQLASGRVQDAADVL